MKVSWLLKRLGVASECTLRLAVQCITEVPWSQNSTHAHSKTFLKVTFSNVFISCSSKTFRKGLITEYMGIMMEIGVNVLSVTDTPRCIFPCICLKSRPKLCCVYKV